MKNIIANSREKTESETETKELITNKEAEKQPTKQSATSYNHKLKVNTICSK